MKEKLNLHELLPEKREYSFEEGVEKIIQKIEFLLGGQDYVVVAIYGPTLNDTDVGKSTLKSAICSYFIRNNMPVISPDRLDYLPHHLKNLEIPQESYASNKGVIILGALDCVIKKKDPRSDEIVEKYKKIEDSRVAKICKEGDLPVSKIDFRVLIYRPDRGSLEDFDSPMADMVIRNDQAIDKLR